MTLNDRYLVERGRVYLTGIQALARLPIDQMRRDRRAGLNTAAFISGYEGSPLGGYDLALARIRTLLDEHGIHFVPGVNEDLAATAILGTQICETAGKPRVDGVVGVWYGKGPGVDRSGDVFRHANLAGTSRLGAALVLAGDDHISKSSTIPHQSDLSLYNVGIPIFQPGNTQEILDYGLLAIALSRFSGAWCALKLVTNVCDGGGTVEVDPDRPAIVIPEGYAKATDPRLLPPFSLKLEYEVNHRRLEAAREFARANRVNRWFGAREGAWLGIATAGKSYYDLMQALGDLAIGTADLERLGIRMAKFAMTFPLEPRFAREFAEGLETALVIEEKRSFLELQLREALYNEPRRPVIVGKQDESGAVLFPAAGELDPDRIAKALGPRLLARTPFGPASERLEVIEEVERAPREKIGTRPPVYCSGCPHNRSTRLLEGQVAGGGIGCHGMALLLEHAQRGAAFITHMGGEGAVWIGMAPFVDRKHIFQNIGDGTYFHSGALAVEACVAAGVNITYKILYNGAVAMTGGQPVEGALPVPELARKLKAEGVRKIVVVTDEVAAYRDPSRLPASAKVRHRDDLPRVLRELEQTPGVTALIYDQQCAAEKRRLRSRGRLEEPVVRVVIHEEVCEGCGDCFRQSNCVSLQPVETEYGQKMRIHQPSCNKDYSCLLGECPSFVTVKLKPGTGLRRKQLPELPSAVVGPPREMARAGDGYRILMAGIGGTGVVTANALLATAAIMDGLSVITLDQTGLAQKGGSVVSHLVLSERPVEASAKINCAKADAILGFDALGAAHPQNLACAHTARTTAVINTDVLPTPDAIRGRKALAGPDRLVELIEARTRRGRNLFVDATRLAEGLFGSHLAVNLFLIGVAWQAGLIPVTAASIEEAIRLNGVEGERNLAAFLWGRRYYQDATWVEQFVAPPTPKLAETAPLVERRAADLVAYQGEAYAEGYREFIRRVETKAPELAEVVACYLYKLMAYKDEYEVARLLTRPEFEERLGGEWEAVESVAYNLHPPLLRALGLKRKLKLGPWFRPALRALARLRFLRGTPLDPFGYAAVRREERALIGWYRGLIEQVLEHVTAHTLPLALEIAALPDQIRGYENVKLESVSAARRVAETKLAEFLFRHAVPATS